MPLEHAPRCSHIKITGHACKSPALRGKNFCYFHQRVFRGVAIPYNSSIDPMLVLEDADSLQYALMEIMNAILVGRIEHRTASLLLRALNIAQKNIRHVRFNHGRNQMVQEIPNYARQYLNEHPEYDPPTAEAESKTEGEAKAEIAPQTSPNETDENKPIKANPAANPEPLAPPEPATAAPSQPPMPNNRKAPASVAPAPAAASIQASDARLSRRQTSQWDELRNMQHSINRAHHGSLRDFKKCMAAIGLTAPRPKSR